MHQHDEGISKSSNVTHSAKTCSSAKDKSANALFTAVQRFLSSLLNDTKKGANTLEELQGSTLALQDTLQSCQAAHDLPGFYDEWVKEVTYGFA